MKSNTSLMRQIKKEAKIRQTKAVDAVVNGEYIIPGFNGLMIDEDKSYSKMVSSGFFDENQIVYQQIIPSLSLNDNISKIIKKANYLKKAIAIITDNKDHIDYFNYHNVKADYLMDMDNIINNYKNIELINNEINAFYKMEDYLNKNNININICLINSYNKDICRQNKKYLVSSTYTINNSNIANYISEIDSGDIIKLGNLTLENLHVLINKINYRNLHIVFLSELISENNLSI